MYLDASNHLLHVTNYDYTSGSYAAYALDKNSRAILKNVYVDNFTSEIENALKGQNASHAHQAVPYGRFVYVVDKGLNKILHYEVSIKRIEILFSEK